MEPWSAESPTQHRLTVTLLDDDGTETDLPGGSAANVAVALARLGRPVRLATSFADDAACKDELTHRLEHP